RFCHVRSTHHTSPRPLFCLALRPPPPSPLFPYTTLFRSQGETTTVTGEGFEPNEIVDITVDGVLVGDDVQVDENGEFSFDYVTTDRKSTRLNSSHVKISYAVFCLKKKKKQRVNMHMIAIA